MTDSELLPRSRRWPRYFYLAGYFVSWIAATGLAFFPVAHVWDTFRLSPRIGDSVIGLAFLFGTALGLWGAIRTRNARVFHWVCIVLGAVIVPLGVLLAVRFFKEADRLTGTGPLAGVGEVIAAVAALAFAFFGILVLGIGLFGRLSYDSPN